MARKTARERLAERDSRARSELFDALFEPWIGGGNNPALQARIGAIDPRDAGAVTAALNADIVPVFEGMTRETQGRIRTALAVITEAGGEEFRVYWLELPPPFGDGEADGDLLLAALNGLLAARRAR